MEIRDGRGTGESAGVTAEGRLLVNSVNLEESELRSLEGSSFSLSSGEVTLTSGCESALLHILNNEDRDLVISVIIVSPQGTTCGTGYYKTKIYRNPTSGTIVSTATAANVTNRNYGSQNQLCVCAFKGVEGNSTTNGNLHFVLTEKTHDRLRIPIDDIILPKGASLSMSFTPPTGNTSMPITLTVVAYLHKNGNG